MGGKISDSKFKSRFRRLLMSLIHLFIQKKCVEHLLSTVCQILFGTTEVHQRTKGTQIPFPKEKQMY